MGPDEMARGWGSWLGIARTVWESFIRRKRSVADTTFISSKTEGR